MSDELTLEQAIDNIYASLKADNADLDQHIAALKATMAREGVKEAVFEPGKLHVMAMDLDDTLQKGGTTDVTLEFTGGDQAEFPVQILAAGDAR